MGRCLWYQTDSAKKGRLKCKYSFILTESHKKHFLEGRKKKKSSSNLCLNPWGELNGSQKADQRWTKSNTCRGYLPTRARQARVLIVLELMRTKKQKSSGIHLQHCKSLHVLKSCFFSLPLRHFSPFCKVCGKMQAHLLADGSPRKIKGNNKKQANW